MSKRSKRRNRSKVPGQPPADATDSADVASPNGKDSTSIQAGPPRATSIQAGRPRDARGPDASGRMGQVTVEPFSAMCNVTLHWEKITPALREEIEDELRRNLDECRTLDNPSAGWFLAMSSLLFFLSIGLIVFYILIYYSRR